MSASTQSFQHVHRPRLLSDSDIALRNAMKKNKNVVFWLGVTEIILGLISCVIGIVTLGKHKSTRQSDYRTYYLSYHFPKHYDDRQIDVGQGIWCGFFFIVCGVVGVSIRFKATLALYRVNLITGVLGAVLMLALTVLSCNSASAANVAKDRFFAWYIILALIGVSGLIIAIIHVVFSNVNKSNRRKPEGCVRYTAVPQGAQQAMIPVQMPNGQIIYYPPQPFYPMPMSLNPANAQYPMLPMTMPHANQIVRPTYPNLNQTATTNIPFVSNFPPLHVSLLSPSNDSCISPPAGNDSNCHPGQVVLPFAQPVETPIPQSSQAQANPSIAAASDRPPSYSEFYNKDQ